VRESAAARARRAAVVSSLSASIDGCPRRCRAPLRHRRRRHRRYPVLQCEPICILCAFAVIVTPQVPLPPGEPLKHNRRRDDCTVAFSFAIPSPSPGFKFLCVSQCDRPCLATRHVWRRSQWLLSPVPIPRPGTRFRMRKGAAGVVFRNVLDDTSSLPYSVRYAPRLLCVQLSLDLQLSPSPAHASSPHAGSCGAAAAPQHGLPGRRRPEPRSVLLTSSRTVTPAGTTDAFRPTVGERPRQMSLWAPAQVLSSRLPR